MLSRKIAPLASVIAACAFGSTSVFACGDTLDGEARGQDGGEDVIGPAVAECPASAPAEGAGCPLPEGTTCVFDACGVTIVRCTRGIWRKAANALPRLPCPTETPESDSPCPACWPPSVTCTYGSVDCSAADVSLNTATASCLDRKWSVEFRPCGDAGADVQGDASLVGD